MMMIITMAMLTMMTMMTMIDTDDSWMLLLVTVIVTKMSQGDRRLKGPDKDASRHMYIHAGIDMDIDICTDMITGMCTRHI